MKRLIAVILATAILFCLCVPWAAASEATDAYRECTFSVSFYHDEAQEYILENKTFTASGITIFRTVNFLKTRGMIADFTQGEADLLELRYYVIPKSEEPQEALSSTEESLPANASSSVLTSEEDPSEPPWETALLRSNDVERFYVKRNGQLMTSESLNQYLRDGDVIEWIYGVPPEVSVTTNPLPEDKPLAAPSTDLWTDTAETAFSDACEWLNRNPNSLSLYLTALGCAGKTAETKTVAELLTHAKTCYLEAAPEALAQYALNLSYCGYDRSDPDMADLLSRLTEVPFTAEDGLSARAYTMLALDCRNYTVPNASEHNRPALVKELLSFQQKDGGFPAKVGSVSDVDSTALALIALSAYRAQENVSVSVEKALAYLAAEQLDSGNFKSGGRVNCKSAALTVTALCALDTGLREERFVKNGKNPLDVLLEYVQPDGGFSLTQGGASSEDATELAVIALSAVKRNGNPFRVPAALATVPVTSPQEKIPAAPSDTPVLVSYAAVGGACLASAVFLVVLLIRYLRKNRTLSVSQGEETPESEKKSGSGEEKNAPPD